FSVPRASLINEIQSDLHQAAATKSRGKGALFDPTPEQSAGMQEQLQKLRQKMLEKHSPEVGGEYDEEEGATPNVAREAERSLKRQLNEKLPWRRLPEEEAVDPDLLKYHQIRKSAMKPPGYESDESLNDIADVRQQLEELGDRVRVNPITGT